MANAAQAPVAAQAVINSPTPARAPDVTKTEEEQQQDAGDSEDEDPDDRPLCFLPGRPGQAPAAAEPKTWRKGEKEKQFDDWGNVVPDDDPLASYKADYVWESPDGCHTVCFHDPIKKPRQNSAALGEHGGELSEYQFYSRMKVVNDQGKTYSFDLKKPTNEVAVVAYGEDASGDEILIYADVLGMYTKDNEPWIEHGYFYDRAEIKRDKECRQFLKKTERGNHGKIEEKELINSVAVYHSPAEVVQGIAMIWHGEDEDSLPLQKKSSTRAFFWRRVLDVSTSKEVSPSEIGEKLIRLPRPTVHPANARVGAADE